MKREALAVTFAGYDIGALSRLSLAELAEVLLPAARGRFGASAEAPGALTEEKRIAAQRIARNVIRALETLPTLGLGYLSLERSTPSLSPGELQRLRLATQIRSNLFGVVYVLDEPSAGLASGRHRGAHQGARSAEARRATRCSWSSTTST